VKRKKAPITYSRPSTRLQGNKRQKKQWRTAGVMLNTVLTIASARGCE
jgi:hypothetical protein